MATRIHKPFKVIAFNANGNGQQRFELSKQLRDHRTHVALGETFLIPLPRL
jgi:hypothetical protein